MSTGRVTSDVVRVRAVLPLDRSKILRLCSVVGDPWTDSRDLI